jgi:hypothetical protein
MVLVQRLTTSKSTKDIIQRLILEKMESIKKAKVGRKRKRKRGEKYSTTALINIVPLLDIAQVGLCGTSGSSKTQTVIAYGEIVGDKLVSYIQSISALVKESTGKLDGLGRKCVGLLQTIKYLVSSANQKVEIKDLNSIVDMVQTCSRDGMDPYLRCIAIEILGALGDSLEKHATKSDVERILQVLTDLLRSNSWPLRSQGLAAFVSVATKIPQTYKGALRECLPSSLLKAFQSRVKKTALSTRLDIQNPERRHLLSLPNPLPVDQTNLFPARENIELVEGSYILKMPTLDGRSAIVLFPPDPASLSDIRYMLSSDETGDEPVVHKIHRIVAHNGGCKLSLSRNE